MVLQNHPVLANSSATRTMHCSFASNWLKPRLCNSLSIYFFSALFATLREIRFVRAPRTTARHDLFVTSPRSGKGRILFPAFSATLRETLFRLSPMNSSFVHRALCEKHFFLAKTLSSPRYTTNDVYALCGLIQTARVYFNARSIRTSYCSFDVALNKPTPHSGKEHILYSAFFATLRETVV